MLSDFNASLATSRHRQIRADVTKAASVLSELDRPQEHANAKQGKISAMAATGSPPDRSGFAIAPTEKATVFHNRAKPHVSHIAVRASLLMTGFARAARFCSRMREAQCLVKGKDES